MSSAIGHGILNGLCRIAGFPADRFGIFSKGEIADTEHISVNQLVMAAIAEKVSALATEKYLNNMAAKGSVEAFDLVMSKVKKCQPLPGDEM